MIVGGFELKPEVRPKPGWEAPRGAPPGLVHGRSQEEPKRLLVGGVLGDGLGALGDGVLGQLTRQDEA
eukprot:COSAG02_NODE_6096_length_3802_cov_8.071294_6_plen_67_part_01